MENCHSLLAIVAKYVRIVKLYAKYVIIVQCGPKKRTVPNFAYYGSIVYRISR